MVIFSLISPQSVLPYKINECAAFEVIQKAFVAEHGAFIFFARLGRQH